ncbi:19744_t:CDS:2, partial [Gigaspora margarita]
WAKIYKPTSYVQENCYKNLLKEISEKKWKQILSSLSLKSVLDISGISYILIKNLYAIPKNKDWDYNLNNIRPITLLKTFRKYITKIFTLRLFKIFKENTVLKEYNFAGLSSCSIEAPIHILNLIIEEIVEKKKEL